MRATVGSIYTESVEIGSIRYKYQIKRLQQKGRVIGIRKFIGKEPIIEIYEDLPSFIADYWKRQSDGNNEPWILEKN